MNPRAGVTLHLILAILLGLVILGVAALFNSARQAVKPTLLMKLKADFQMESAMVMTLQKINLASATSPEALASLNVQEREIAPGVGLTLLTTPVSDHQIRFAARVEGSGLQRRLSAQAVLATSASAAPPASLTVDAPPATNALASGTADPSPHWRLEFLPEDRADHTP